MATFRPDHPPSAFASLSAPNERWRLVAGGRVRDCHAGDVDRVVTCAMHLWPLGFPLIGPLAPLIPVLLWTVFRRNSPFIDDHGREVMNGQLMLLLLVVLVCPGWLLLIPWCMVWMVSLVRGAVAAASSELFRYPMLVRMLK